MFNKKLAFIRQSTEAAGYLFEATVQVKLPPVQMVGVEREIIVLTTVARVGQNITSALCKAQEDVTGRQQIEKEMSVTEPKSPLNKLAPKQREPGLIIHTDY